ncbi:MAG: PilW family protein, partial [Thermoanaerobaculia bacterium]
MYKRTDARGQRGFTLSEVLVAVAVFTIIMVAALVLYDRSNKVFKGANESAEMQQNTRVAFEKLVSDIRMAGFDYKRAGTPASGVPTAWAANRTYTEGVLATPTSANGHVYRVIQGGTSGGSQPSWPTSTGGTVNDGTVRWIEAGSPVYEQPDEQIEYAGETAITIRANFDYETTSDQGREEKLEESSKGAFPLVTTGNHEIVTYALRSRSTKTGVNDDKVEFYADVNAGGTAQSRTAYPGGNDERLVTISNIDTSNEN